MKPKPAVPLMTCYDCAALIRPGELKRWYETPLCHSCYASRWGGWLARKALKWSFTLAVLAGAAFAVWTYWDEIEGWVRRQAERPAQRQQPVGTPPKVQTAPLTKEEHAVKAFLLDQANDPRSIEFVKWGPHSPPPGPADRENFDFPNVGLIQLLVAPLPADFCGRDYPVLRLRLRGKNKAGALEVGDALFAVKGGRVEPYAPNRWGDDWVAGARAEWAATKERNRRNQEAWDIETKRLTGGK